LRIRTVCLALTAVLLFFSATHFAQADISQVNFLGALYKGTDPFYGQTVVAYKTGANVTVAISTYNSDFNFGAVNITAVKMWFDWGANYTSNEVNIDNIFQLERYESHVFMITFVLPTNISNIVTHSYTAYVEYAFGENVSISDVWTRQGSDFAVYSGDQADAQDLYAELATFGVLQPLGYYYYYYTPPILNFPYLPFVSSEARMLWSQARNSGTVGTMYYTRGDFTSAKTYFQEALDMVNQSFVAESGTGKSYEDGFASLMGGIGNAFNRSGDSILIAAAGIGLGAALFGVGVLIYGFAKLRTARPSQTSAK